MSMFHVYVEGPVDASPDAVKQLAEAIAAKYGLPAADLHARLTKGRFRVKANVDRPTAETYVNALQGVGARVTVEDAHPTQPVPVVRPSSPALPPANAARPSSPALPAAAESRPSASSLPPATTKPKAAQLQSGLSAAFSGEAPAASLGALEDLSLASLDGNDDASSPASSFAPPDAAQPMPASIGPATTPTPKAAKPAAAPLDLFAPPDAESAEAQVELATDEIEHRAKRAHSAPAAAPASPPSAPLSPPLRRSSPSMQAASEPVAVVADDTKQRARFAAGVFLAILVGFLPAHLVASARERSTFRGIDSQVETTQAAADTPDMYAQLDSFRDAQLSHKKSEQRNIAMVSMLIWAVVGGAVAFGWFRLAPWNRPANA
jgi:hypothetical protein